MKYVDHRSIDFSNHPMNFAKVELNTERSKIFELSFYVKITRLFKNPTKLPGINTEDLRVSFS